MQCCVATEIRVSERHLSGIKNYSRGMEERKPVLKTRRVSSLVVDRLCDQARGQNSTVICFYFDFADRKEQSATVIQAVQSARPQGRTGWTTAHSPSFWGDRTDYAWEGEDRTDCRGL